MKIKVKERVKVYKPAAKPSEDELAEADSLALEAAIAGANENKSAAKQVTAQTTPAKKPATTKTTPKPAQTTPAKKPATTTSQPTTHTVKSGESFYLIAKRYGVTIDAIKKANGLTSDKLKPGQKLKIPKKTTTTNTRSTAKTTKKK